MAPIEAIVLHFHVLLFVDIALFLFILCNENYNNRF